MFLTTGIRASEQRGPGDDFWYMPLGAMSASGQNITSDSALRIAAVYACVKVLSETVAQLPLHLYRRMGDGGKERAVRHPLYAVLNRRPNRWQTSFEWREMMQGHAALRGNAYSRIVYGLNGRVQELVPMHPDRTTIEMLGEHDFRYRYRRNDGTEETLLRSEVFHLRGLSSDGVVGMNPIEVEREAIGVAAAAQDYAARFFRNDATPGGWIEHPGAFKDTEQKEHFRQAWQKAQSGGNRGKTAVLEFGMKYHELGIKNTDAQFLETRKYQIGEIARIFRMPPHKIGDLEKATFSNIEHMGIEFVVDTMMPWFRRWEQAISRDLIVDEDTYFAEFLVDGLLRGDSKSRGEFYASGINTGWLTRNEVRIAENRNPLPGLDEPLEPLNMARAGDERAPEDDGRSQALAKSCAQRLVGKEVTAIQRAAGKCDWKPDAAWHDWFDQFCAAHVPFVAEVMAVSGESALAYVDDMRAEVFAAVEHDELRSMLESWKTVKAAQLVERFGGEHV